MASKRWGGAITAFFAIVISMTGYIIWHYGGVVGLNSKTTRVIAWVISSMVIAVLMIIPALLSLFSLRHKKSQAEAAGHYPSNNSSPVQASSSDNFLDTLTTHLRYRYGRRWKSSVRILLVLGDTPRVEQLVPRLASQQWLEGEGTLLVWGGSATAAPDAERMQALRKLRRRRPVDAMLWVADEQQSRQAAQVDAVVRQLHQRYQALGWQVPVYLWELQHSEWQQSERVSQPVGCLLAANASPDGLEKGLRALTPLLSEQGMQQLIAHPRHDFLLRLAQDLATDGIARLKQSLQPLIAGPQALHLAGVMFSLPAGNNLAVAQHSWLADASWKSVLDDIKHQHARRLGVPWEKCVQWSVMGLAALWALGSLLSFTSNRAQLKTSSELAQAAGESKQPLDTRITRQLALQQEIARLQYQHRHGAPWYQRFGLDQSGDRLAALWPWYARSNNALMRDETVSHLQQQLAQMPAAARKADYDRLKALLMMAHPQKSDAAFLSAELVKNWPQREGVSAGIWQSSAPALYGFYAQNLPQHPEWRITPDSNQINAARRTLLRTTASRSVEDRLYQQMLHQLAPTFSELTLNQMVGDTDASSLFSTGEVVPGIFTRQAWEQQVKPAMTKLVAQRREAVDWVLTDNPDSAEKNLSPDTLQARLTSHYFTDFANVWQNFLNSISWNSSDNLSDAIDQMTLMTDARQSPLVALMDTVVYQAETGQHTVTEQLNSTQDLFSAPAATEVKTRVVMPGPMADTFTPLLALAKGDTGGQGSNHLSLQTFMTRVNRVRLKLQQITHSADPQAMAQSLAQTVFQGKSVDLADTRDYGSLMSASLGQAWNGFGEALFVQPLEQAWQQVLSPTSQSLNSQWQHAIVDEWNKSFAGRYPFNSTQSDASLPLLAKYLRSDSGRIDAFIKSRLNGVLHKEGNQWVPDVMNTQGMQINPAFLRAVNQLSALSDILFASGDAGMHFELMARPSRNVVQTDITIDGQDIKYFNQMESWSAISWPGNVYKPGVILNWSSVNAGSRQYADYQGSWGLIRLLERADVKQLDSSRYQVSWKAQDGLPLNYILRTEAGSGPLALLELKGFRLPEQIFL